MKRFILNIARGAFSIFWFLAFLWVCKDLLDAIDCTECADCAPDKLEPSDEHQEAFI